MESIDGGMQVHYSLSGHRPELLSYTVDIPRAGKYGFTAHVCTVTVDRQFLLRVNRRTLVDVDERSYHAALFTRYRIRWYL